MPEVTKTEEMRRIVTSIRKIVRALRIASCLTDRTVGLSGAQLFVLQQLSQGEALSANDLAERTLTHQSSVSVVVSRLREKGLVIGHPSPNDGRCLALSLTEKRGESFIRCADCG